MDPHTEAFLGIAHDTLISENGPDDQDVMNYDYEPLFGEFEGDAKHKLRNIFRHQCAVHIHELANRFPQQHLIHVADREYDDVFVFLEAMNRNRDFVIRSKADRNVQMPTYDWLPEQALTAKQWGLPIEEGYTCVNLTRVIEAIPLTPYKTVRVDHRGRVGTQGKSARKAKLSIGACSVKLYRHATRNDTSFKIPRILDVNLVVIRETQPSGDDDPLCWVLYTTLPVDTPEQLAFVGRIYELRWRIEEYFKLIKCGYHLEQIRLNNATKTAKLLVILSIAVMYLLELKSELGLPPTGPLDKESYKRIKHAANNLNDKTIDLKLRRFAFIARCGGWNERHTDPIGPGILMRGMIQVLASVHAFTDNRELIEELAATNPIREPKNAYN